MSFNHFSPSPISNFILVEFTLCNKLLLQYISQHEALQDMDDFLQSKAIRLTLVSDKLVI